MVEKDTISNTHLSLVKSNININDIWQCKQSYKDDLGEEVVATDDFYVFIVTDVDDFDGEEFVRIQPVSMHIENRTEDDILIEDSTIIDSPFIIETWNEQPIIINILDKKIGEISFELPQLKTQAKYTKQQLNFRAKELDRTAYLRQSVLSSLAQQESDYLRTRKIKTYKTLSIAASFIGIGLFAWQPGRMSNADFYNKYAESYNEPFDYENAGGVMSRGNYYLLPNFTVDESKIIQDALDAYNSNEFEKSIKLLSKIDDLKNKNHQVYFYLGLAQLNANLIDNSIYTFTQLIEGDSDLFYSDLLYNLAIAYVKNGNTIKARKTIKQLQKYDSNYLDNREDILKELRWF